MLEILESRQLMSGTAHPQPAPLLISGTTHADAIVIAQVGDKITVLNNGVSSTLSASLITKVVIDAGIGDGDLVCLRDLKVAAQVKVKANVFNVPACGQGTSVLLPLSADAKVFAKLNLSAGLKINASANISAIVGVFAKLSVDAGGNLCGPGGVRVDVNACIGLLAKLGAKVSVSALSDSACVSLCAKLGVSGSSGGGLLGISLGVSAHVNACIGELAHIGAGLNLNLLGIIHL